MAPTFTDRITTWVGSTTSIVLHTFFFLFSFLVHWLFQVDMSFILLILTTAVSLEAIYLALFIQRSVNNQLVRINEVNESLDDVEEDLEESEERIGKTSRRNERLLKDLHIAVAELREAVEILKK